MRWWWWLQLCSTRVLKVLGLCLPGTMPAARATPVQKAGNSFQVFIREHNLSTKSGAQQWKALSDCAKAEYAQKALKLKELLQEKLVSVPAPEKVWQDGWPVWFWDWWMHLSCLVRGTGNFCDVTVLANMVDALTLRFDHALSHAPNVFLSLKETDESRVIFTAVPDAKQPQQQMVTIKTEASDRVCLSDQASHGSTIIRVLNRLKYLVSGVRMTQTCLTTDPVTGHLEHVTHPLSQRLFRPIGIAWVALLCGSLWTPSSLLAPLASFQCSVFCNLTELYYLRPQPAACRCAHSSVSNWNVLTGVRGSTRRTNPSWWPPRCQRGVSSSQPLGQVALACGHFPKKGSVMSAVGMLFLIF